MIYLYLLFSKYTFPFHFFITLILSPTSCTTYSRLHFVWPYSLILTVYSFCCESSSTDEGLESISKLQYIQQGDLNPTTTCAQSRCLLMISLQNYLSSSMLSQVTIKLCPISLFIAKQVYSKTVWRFLFEHSIIIKYYSPDSQR